MALVLTDQQRQDWLRLIRTDGVGPRTFRSLVNRYGGAGAALAALPDLARQAGRTVRLASLADIEREMEQARRLGVRFVAMGEAGYPPALMASATAPPLLAVRGRVEVLARPMVSIVGSRNASAAGMKFTETLARDLGQAGFVVVSGLARGIDTAAHKASLQTGTVAVLAGGQGQIYPPQNEPLVEALIEQGCAISELPFSVEPRARDFPRRNRIVAAMALGVVVVEAARASGSLITARLALEEGREVFAVPGSPLDPRAEGANQLLHAREARMCRSADDIIAELEPQIAAPKAQASLFEAAGGDGAVDVGLDELDWIVGPALRETAAMSAGRAAETGSGDGAAGEEGDDAAAWALGSATDGRQAPPLEARILASLGHAAISIDDLARLHGGSARAVQAALLELELQGLVARDEAGGYRRGLSVGG